MEETKRQSKSMNRDILVNDKSHYVGEEEKEQKNELNYCITFLELGSFHL